MGRDLIQQDASPILCNRAWSIVGCIKWDLHLKVPRGTKDMHPLVGHQLGAYCKQGLTGRKLH